MSEQEDRDRLAERTLALVSISSVSRSEAEAMTYVHDQLPLEPLFASDDVLFATTARRDGRPFVVLAGHVDTVPAQDNLPGRIEDGWVVGLGATDMKGGVAVMVELAAWALSADLELDLGFLFFTREELPAEESPLPAFLGESRDAAHADLAIVLEPTDNEIHVGCVGNLSAQLTFRGVSAHSARPWTGENAIHRAAATLAPLAELEPRRRARDPRQLGSGPCRRRPPAGGEAARGGPLRRPPQAGVDAGCPVRRGRARRRQPRARGDALRPPGGRARRDLRAGPGVRRVAAIRG